MSKRRQGFADLLSHLPVMVYRCGNDEDCTLEEASQGCLAVTGHSREDLLKEGGVSFADLVHPEDSEQLHKERRVALNLRCQYEIEYRIIAPKGAVRWVSDSGRGIYAATGEALGLEGVLVILDSKQVEDEGKFSELFDASPDAVFVEDLEGYVLNANLEACRLHDVEREQLIGVHFSTLVPPDELDGADRDFRMLVEGKTRSVEGLSLSKDGAIVPVELRASRIDYAGKPALLLHVRDITERMRNRERLERLAHFDALTDLPNRRLLEDRFRQALARSVRTGERIAMHVLDLDYFKGVNDTYGHGLGDELLKSVAARLAAELRETDTVARLGGDEFAILQVGVRNAEGATELAMRLLEAFAEPFEIRGHQIRIGASIGVAIWEAGAEEEDLFEQADRALFRAKELGRNTFHFHNEQLAKEASAYIAIREDLGPALERGEFFLEYQPQIDLTSGDVAGCEALVRWKHPEKGVIYPRSFIPISEKTGLMVQLGNWILREACRQRREWFEAGLQGFAVAVNVSAVQFKDPNFSRWLSDMLDATKLDAGFLEVELTESVLLERSMGVQDGIRGAHELGVRITVDDFGTGYSSLQYLKQFPVHKLKIAKEFVQGITSSPEDASIVEAVIGLARRLGIRVVAEGIETPEQLDFLHQHGCDIGQGFLFSRPAAPDLFARQIAAGIEH